MRRAALLAAATVALVTAGAAAPAFAHNYLVASTPEVGGVLTELPEQFSVTTNENLLDLGGDGNGFGIDVLDADGLYYGDGCVSVSGPSLTTVPALGEPGKYTLVYQFVSADGHSLSDEFTFTWAPEGEYEAATGSTTQPDCNGTLTRGGESEAAPEAAPVDLSTVLWIGGAVLALVVAVGGGLLLTRRTP